MLDLFTLGLFNVLRSSFMGTKVLNSFDKISISMIEFI